MFDKTFGTLVFCVISIVFISYVYTDVSPSVAGDPKNANQQSLKKEVTRTMWSIVPK